MSSRTVLPSRPSNKITLPSPGNYSGALHNSKHVPDMQERKESHLLSWAELPSSTSNPTQWTVLCKINHLKVNGEVKGIGVAPQKAMARQAAARQACEPASFMTCKYWHDPYGNTRCAYRHRQLAP
ncbi:hypothetical protein FPV67DRAFT_1445972 [Lyophyllum atratum]|nr:hypothetical protein FPV67DRAFT_1445972 [Lyophyllum atratum]